MDGSYFPSASEIKSRWSVMATKSVLRAPIEIERAVGDVAAAVLGADGRTGDPRRWQFTLRRPMSMFDAWEVTIVLVGEDEGLTSSVEVEIMFDASEARVAMIAALAGSVVLIPFGAAWRWQSVRSAKQEAQSMIDAMWKAVDASVASRGYAYR